MLVCPFFASTVSFQNMICVEKKVNRVTRLHGEKLLFCYCKCKWFRVELTREKWQHAGIFPFLTLNFDDDNDDVDVYKKGKENIDDQKR